jgi:hypothetical protein
VVLQGLAHAGQVVHHRQADRLELRLVADAGQLQELRRPDSARGEDDLAAACHRLGALPSPVPHADRTTGGDVDPGDEHLGQDVEVAAPPHRVQVGAGGVLPPAAPDPLVERREALLPQAVGVGQNRVPRLPHRLEERLEDRPLGRAAHQRVRPAAPARGVDLTDTVLEPAEVGQTVRVIPFPDAGLLGPPVEVGPVTAGVEHPVDAARTAEHLAARMGEAPRLQPGLGFRRVAPVVPPAPDRRPHGERELNRQVPGVVRLARLEHQHLRAGIGAQPVGEDAPRRPTAHDDEVVDRFSHVRVGHGRVNPQMTKWTGNRLRAPWGSRQARSPY